jgi:hypothetical protein
MVGDEPSWDEAMRGPERELWLEAGAEQIARIQAKGTYELVEAPPDANIVGCVWVLRKKRDQNNRVVKRKARACAQGYTQEAGVDFHDTAAPTCRPSSQRFVLGLANKNDWEVHQVDFKDAYLNGVLDEEVYMRQPKGFEEPGREHFVWRLLKAIYGLKQAGRQWYKKLCELFDKLGFTRSSFDPAVFFYIDEPDIICIVAVHVDDCTLVANTLPVMLRLKAELNAHYELVDLGEVRWLLGFEVRRDRARRILQISQAAYIDTILERFAMTDCRPVSTPMDPHAASQLVVGKTTDDERAFMRGRPYAKLIGSVMYAAIISRPDVSYAVSTLSQALADPTPAHWQAGRYLLRYLKSTRDLCLTFEGSDGELKAYSDADWASQLHRHSISGSVFLYGGAAISWSSRKQPIIALSSTEAEYIAASDALRELLWLRLLISELSTLGPGPTDLLCDNQSAISLAKNGLLSARTKHIDIRYHFIREKVDLGVAALTYCPTTEMAADILTKALSRAKLEYFRWMLGVRPA